MSEPLPIVLASGSATRQAMLANAGLEFVAQPATVDETALKQHAIADGLAPAQIAVKLATAKAMTVSATHPSSLVIGSDQILELDGELLTKTKTRREALDKLRRLQGKTHYLHSAVTCCHRGKVELEFVDTAEMTMKRMRDAELERYIDVAEPGLYDAVGCYQIEGPGIRLFSSVRGSHFTIMGMPLLPLLAFLDNAKTTCPGA